jgi:hypothetical protein
MRFLHSFLLYIGKTSGGLTNDWNNRKKMARASCHYAISLNQLSLICSKVIVNC